MPIDINITVDAAEVLRLLDAIDQGGWARKVGEAVAEEVVLPALRYYPPQSGKKQPPRSAAQRRKIFALIREGKVPYQRTSKLATGWNVRNTSLYTTEVFNRVGYAELVQGSNQAPYHRGTWKNVDTVAQEAENDGDAQRVAERVIEEEIKRYTP